MTEVTETSNTLISQRPSSSNLAVSLHPLVLLTVSDHLIRHLVRNEEGPIVGALLGQQKGREITIEHAFQCRVITNDAGEALLDQNWFETRLQQYKDVHKLPTLEFVGWFTLCPEDGPTSAVLPIQKQIIWTINESALLLAFHPSAISPSAPPNTTGRLPLTIYESSFENEPGKRDGSMQIDDEGASGIKFRPLPYSIETDETEMIAIDHVAKGAGNASAVSAGGVISPSLGTTEETDKKGKKRAEKTDEELVNGSNDSTSSLSLEEEDQIVSMTTRLNSVRMLQSRLSLLSTFVRLHSSSYLTDASTPITQTAPDPAQVPHLRNVQALLTRLSLITPSAVSTGHAAVTNPTDPLISASLSQSNDVALSSLLALLGQDIQGMSELGRKFLAVEQTKVQKGKGKGAFGSGNFGVGGDDSGMGMGSMLV